MSQRRLSFSLSRVRSARVSFDVVWSALIAIGSDNAVASGNFMHFDIEIASFIRVRPSSSLDSLVSKPI
jgi:hypothetical protein